MEDNGRARRAWGFTLLAGMAVVSGLPSFFRFIEERPGSRPMEPLLDRIPPMDVSLPLFLVLYITLALGLVVLFRTPPLLLRGLQAYVLLLILRMVSMVALTLEPPLDLVPLVDPFTQFFYPDAEPFRKDLFFSGHTATVFLLFLVIPDKRWRWPLLAVTLFVGIAVLVQHVHWTIDVVAAPMAAWIAWRASALTARWGGATVEGAGA